MAFMEIQVSDLERQAVARAVVELNEVQHLRYMSRSMISNSSGIKDTKVRAVLQDMINRGELEQYPVTENRKLQRFYYVLTDAGKLILEADI